MWERKNSPYAERVMDMWITSKPLTKNEIIQALDNGKTLVADIDAEASKIYGRAYQINFTDSNGKFTYEITPLQERLLAMMADIADEWRVKE